MNFVRFFTRKLHFFFLIILLNFLTNLFLSITYWHHFLGDLFVLIYFFCWYHILAVYLKDRFLFLAVQFIHQSVFLFSKSHFNISFQLLKNLVRLVIKYLTIIISAAYFLSVRFCFVFLSVDFLPKFISYNPNVLSPIDGNPWFLYFEFKSNW